MRIELTETGGRAALACVAVALWGALFVDYLLMGLGLAGLGFLVYRYRRIRMRLRALPGQVSFTPSRLDGSFTAGDGIEEVIRIECGSPAGPRILMPYGVLQPPPLRRGEQTRIYSFEPSLAADYGFDHVGAAVVDELDLFAGETELGFSARFRVYPRVFSVALDALTYLEGGGILGAGEQVSEMKGRGYEYAESREYVEGDSLRQIDWKATARLGKLIVKEYYLEGSGAVHIIYDNRVPDPVSGDVLAASYLRTVLSFAERGWVIGLTVLSEDGVESHFPDLYPGFAVSVALRHVLETRIEEIKSYFEVLDPVHNVRLRRVLGERLPESGAGFGVLKDGMYGSKYGGVIYVTSLTGNPAGLMELSYTARVNRTRFVVLEPCVPWRYAGLEDGYRVLGHYDRVNRSLMRDGVPLAVSLVEAQEKLGELEPVYL